MRSLVCALSFSLWFISSVSVAMQSKPEMLRFLDGITATFEARYAPDPFKESKHGDSIDSIAAQVREAILAEENLDNETYQGYLKQFFNAFRDYHVSYNFISTESASLPFQVLPVGKEDEFYFVYIDREVLPERVFPFQVGDQLTSFGGLSPKEVVDSLSQQVTQGNPDTSNLIASMLLTQRDKAYGLQVPQGPILIKVRKQGGEREYLHQLVWDYRKEKITTPLANSASSSFKGLMEQVKNPLITSHMMMSPRAYELAQMQPNNPYQLGARKSFVPTLGEVVWQTPEQSFFHAYVYKSGEKNIGYIRIPAFYNRVAPNRVFAEAFATLMQKFQQETDALIIDQVNNSGGSGFYMYALLSMLTDQSLATPRHRFKLTQADVRASINALKILKYIKTDAQARMYLGNEIEGYPVSMVFVGMYQSYCRFIVDQWQQKKTLTDPYHLFGVDYINPYTQADKRYTKPLLVLINELDFSAADFFPAILQDNQRAHLLGVRTAGAGGYVESYASPNKYGLDYFSVTGSLASRLDGTSIENSGVTPDTELRFTVADLRGGFTDYAAQVNQKVMELVAQ
ncbi:MAG: protease-like activity factor CPAF [Zetaproteobacteria bacterium]|nr:protease-like activity factor CPAF [Zetaproteobacteria bacterium]